MSHSDRWLDRAPDEIVAAVVVRRSSSEPVNLSRREKWESELPNGHVRDEERARLREDLSRPCGARTRAGHPCRRKGLGKGGRCPNHGGLSTGPRTEAGRQRIAEAQRRISRSLNR